MKAGAKLLDGLVDYAGLFPPAALSMREAVHNYATYRTGEDRALLARFVLPAARLPEFVAEATPVPADGEPWPLAVLATAADAQQLDAFDAEHGARWLVDSVEAKAATTAEITALAQAFGSERSVYVEVPVKDDPAPLLADIKARGLRAKIRTGGVSADAFPAPGEVLRFLHECVQRRIPFKATAGLHHPLRGEYPLTYASDAPRGTMYGFLNIFFTAVLLYRGFEPALVAPCLEERDPFGFAINEQTIAWRGLKVELGDLIEARTQFAGSFGSCSFEEPVRELTALTFYPHQ